MSLLDTPAEALIGPPRIALNHSTSSIHDADHAKRLGFRGSAVGGNLHLDLFAPLLVETYGQEWFERGAISLYFLNIVVSGEPVQAVVERLPSPGAQTRIHAQRADDPGFRVCEGTASLGDHSRSELAQTETFGPVAAILECDDLDEALTIANSVEQGLVAALCGGDGAQRRRFCAAIEAGIVKLTPGPLQIHALAPFGGWKASQSGPPEHGRWDLEFYSRPQAVYGWEEE